jgi:hypothetical protein
MLEKAHQHHEYFELQPAIPLLHGYLTADAESSSTLCSHFRRRRALTKWHCCFLGRDMGRREGA